MALMQENGSRNSVTKSLIVTRFLYGYHDVCKIVYKM